VYRKYSFGWAIVNTYLTLKGAKRKVAKIAREEAKKSGKDSDSETIWEGVIV
jgi:hypothetical protein